MLIYFWVGDKKPAQGGLISGLAIFSPPDPDGVSAQAFYAYAARFLDLLNHLAPGLGAFVVVARDGDDLDLLNARRGDKALDAPTYQLI
ncbi:hypothetical protein D3C81_778420 [compost metagenome]